MRMTLTESIFGIRCPDIFLSVNRIKSNVANACYAFVNGRSIFKLCILSSPLLWKQKGHSVHVDSLLLNSGPFTRFHNQYVALHKKCVAEAVNAKSA